MEYWPRSVLLTNYGPATTQDERFTSELESSLDRSRSPRRFECRPHRTCRTDASGLCAFAAFGCSIRKHISRTPLERKHVSITQALYKKCRVNSSSQLTKLTLHKGVACGSA